MTVLNVRVYFNKNTSDGVKKDFIIGVTWEYCENFQKSYFLEYACIPELLLSKIKVIHIFLPEKAAEQSFNSDKEISISINTNHEVNTFVSQKNPDA